MACPTGVVDASVVITTRNRRDDTVRAVSSSLAQTGCSLEVLVFDDASDDGTSTVVSSAFPNVRVFSSSVRRGYIYNRNRGFCEARGRIVFSLDDDAYFSATDIVHHILHCFEDDLSIGAVAIPYIEPLNLRSLSSLQTPFCASPGDLLAGFTGCAHAVRRDVALALGGYRDYFIHQGEERDFCLRMMAAGWRTVYGSSELIVHLVSPKRQTSRVNYYGARNLMLFDILNLPFQILIIRLFWDPYAVIRYRFSLKNFPVKILGIVVGLFEGIMRLSERRPVPSDVYLRYTRLRGHGPEQWTHEIPPACMESIVDS